MVPVQPLDTEMSYIFILIAAVGFFAFNAPARSAVGSQISKATASIQAATSDPAGITANATAQVMKLRVYVQSKATEFARNELHRAVDQIVK